MNRGFAIPALLLTCAMAASAAEELDSGDAYIRYDSASNRWTCGTGLIEQQLELADGRFRLSTLQNKLTGTEYAGGAGSDEFHFSFGGKDFTGNSGGYRLQNYRMTRLPVPKTSSGIDPGVSLEINLEHESFAISLHYDVFASTPRTQLGMIRKWYRVTNRTGATQPLTEISLHELRFKPEDSGRFTLYDWRGGGAGSNCNAIEAQSLLYPKTKCRTFYSMAGNPDYRADDIFSGCASYHPYFVLEDAKAGEGVFFGFNYLGPWSMRIWNPGEHEVGGTFPIRSQLELHTEPLAPGASFEAPNSFIGLYRGDLDSANEQLQDWQATFKWDYTREQYLWLSAIYNGHWADMEYRQKTDLRLKEMWRIADLCRRTGAQIAHEDDFWFDQRGRGVWEGIDWKELVDYLRQSGIVFRLWLPPQHYAAGTPVDLEHPEWALDPKVPDGITVWYNLGFCCAAQGAHDYMRQFMLDREKRYGTFYWRLDGWVEAPCNATNHDHPPGQPFVQQYRHYLNLMREVKEANPDMGLQGCNSGGEWANWDKFEFIENNQGSDGGGPDDTYYLSYFWPVTKIVRGGGGSSTRLEGAAAEDRLRSDVLFNRFLRAEGVMDRYMRVYHPRAEGAPTLHTFLQLANSERTKVAILQDAAPQGEVVVYPKALAPQADYSVTFRFNKDAFAAKGEELMRAGIRFKPADRREIILLNLDRAPGRGTDKTPPTAPGRATKQNETWGGRSGVALRWSPSHDDGLIAEYRILKDGEMADRVAIGTFYFDPGAPLDTRYQIVAVDGDGNRSAATTAVGN
ncbi:MAG: hypothetical protein ABSA45_01185 [Verrucomicrobiota bacterium]